MQVSEILESKGNRVVAIEPNVTVADVANTLSRERIGAAIVKKEGGELAGIISERDIIRGLAMDGAAVLGKPVSELMSSSVITCGLESSTQELMEQMMASQIRHLPVVQDEALVGIVSVSDVVKSVLTDLKWTAKVLENQIVTAAGWTAEEDD